jgi:hypothetical protein
VFTRAHHWPVSWARWIYSTPSTPSFLVPQISVLIVSFHLCLILTNSMFHLSCQTKMYVRDVAMKSPEWLYCKHTSILRVFWQSSPSKYHLRTHDEDSYRRLQLSCSPSQWIQSLYVGEMMSSTAILLQWAAGALLVLISRACIHTEELSCATHLIARVKCVQSDFAQGFWYGAHNCKAHKFHRSRMIY